MPASFRLLLLAVALLLFGPGCQRGGSPDSVATQASAVARASGSASASVAAPPRAVPSASASAPAGSTPTAPSGSAAAHATPHRGLFYRVQSATSTVYLLGSIHVGKRSLYPLRPAIETAFDASDVLVLEVHLGTLEKLSAGMKMATAGMYPAGDSLDRHISPKLMRAVQERMRTSGGLLPDPQRARPWFLAMTLTLTELQRLGYDPDHGIDQYFQRRAGSTKPIVGLETVDEQLALFSGLSDRVQELMLAETLEELQNLGEMMQQAYLAWQQGDAQGLDEALLEAMQKPEYGPLFKRVFTDRNVKMARAVEGYLGTAKTHFVVVGSGHLVGKQGVVERLRAKRYPVEQR